MLYDIREAQRAFLNPLSNWADSMSRLYTNPYSPLAYSPFARRISAGLELVHRLGKEYEKPEFGITSTKFRSSKASRSNGRSADC